MGKYENVNVDNIYKGIKSIRGKVATIKANISLTKTALTDEVWKATAKNTLFTAFDTMNDEVCEEILDYCDDLNTLAGLIKDYRNAVAKIDYYQDEANAADKETKGYYNNLKRTWIKAKNEIDDQIELLRHG